MSHKSILLFGAGGKTGQAIVAQGVNRGHKIRAVEHETPFRVENAGDVEHVKADILSDDIGPLLDGVDVVISAIGLPLSPQTVFDPPPLYTEGMSRVVEAMRKAGTTDRVIAISAAFVEQKEHLPLWFRESALKVLRQTYRQMGDMERIFRASGLKATAVRPGWLLDRPLTADYQVGERTLPKGTLRTRHGDLAHFMLTCAEEDSHIGGYPTIARKEGPRYESPAALADELPRLFG